MLTTEFDVQKIDDEILNALRSNLNSNDYKNRVTEKTIGYTTTTETKYLVSLKMNYVKSVTLDNVLLKFGKDYNIHWRGIDKGKIELKVVPLANLNLTIVYGEVGISGSFIYPDLPRNDVGLNTMPRIGFRTSFSRELVGGNGNKIAVNNTGLLQIKILAETTAEVNKLVKAVDDYLFNNFKEFYYVRYIDPLSISNYDNFNDNTDKPFFKIIEYNLPHKYQIGS